MRPSALFAALALVALRYDILAVLARATVLAAHHAAYHEAGDVEARALRELLLGVKGLCGGDTEARYKALTAGRARGARSVASRLVTVAFARQLGAAHTTLRARLEHDGARALAEAGPPTCEGCAGHGDVPTGRRDRHNATGLEACRACAAAPPHAPRAACACAPCEAAFEEMRAEVADLATEHALAQWRADLADLDLHAARAVRYEVAS